MKCELKKSTCCVRLLAVLRQSVARCLLALACMKVTLNSLNRSKGEPLDLCSICGAAMLGDNFILATNAIRLITMVPACLLGHTYNSLIHPSSGLTVLRLNSDSTLQHWLIES